MGPINYTPSVTASKVKKKQTGLRAGREAKGASAADYIDMTKLQELAIELLDNQEHKERTLGMIILLGLVTGLRIKDLLSLSVNNNIDNNEDGDAILKVDEQSKNGKAYRAKLHPTIVFQLQRYVNKMPYVDKHGTLFLNPDYKQIYSPQWVNKRFKNLQAKHTFLKDKVFSTHSLRKSHAYAVYKHYGCDIMRAKEILQHDNVSSTEKYLKLSDKERVEMRSHLADSIFKI